MRYIIKELLRHPWGTVFNIGGYAVASLFILFILSISESNKEDSYGILNSTGTHFILYVPTDVNCCSSGLVDGTIFAEGVRTMMLENDLVRSVKNIEGVRDAAPCLLYKMHDDNFQTDISISGIDTSSVATSSNICARTNVVEGKYISGNPEELVVEQSFATAHNISVGDTLEVFGGKMRIAGIINSGIRPVKADFYAPIETVRILLEDKLQCIAPGFDMNIILVEVADARFQEDVIERARNMMYKFSVSTYNCYQPANKVMTIIERSSFGLTVLIFIFLIVFSAKTQLSVLMERLREVGILKSLGWSDRTLSSSILFSSLLQSVAGVTIGVVAGALIMLVFSNGQEIDVGMKFKMNPGNLAVIYLLSMSGAIIAGILPIIRVFRTKAGEMINKFL